MKSATDGKQHSRGASETDAGTDVTVMFELF